MLDYPIPTNDLGEENMMSDGASKSELESPESVTQQQPMKPNQMMNRAQVFQPNMPQEPKQLIPGIRPTNAPGQQIVTATLIRRPVPSILKRGPNDGAQFQKLGQIQQVQNQGQQPLHQAAKQQVQITQRNSVREQQLIQRSLPNQQQKPGQMQQVRYQSSPPQQQQQHPHHQAMRQHPPNQSMASKSSIREQQLIQRAPNNQQQNQGQMQQGRCTPPQRQVVRQQPPNQCMAQKGLIREQQLIQRAPSNQQQIQGQMQQVQYQDHHPQQHQLQRQGVRHLSSNQAMASRVSVQDPQMIQRTSPTQQQPPQQSSDGTQYSALQRALLGPKPQLRRVVPLPPQQPGQQAQNQLQRPPPQQRQQYLSPPQAQNQHQVFNEQVYPAQNGQQWEPYGMDPIENPAPLQQVVPQTRKRPQTKAQQNPNPRKRPNKKQPHQQAGNNNGSRSSSSSSSASPNQAKRARPYYEENVLTQAAMMADIDPNPQMGYFMPAPIYETPQEPVQRRIATDPKAPLPDLTWIINGHEIRVIRSKDPSMRLFPDYI